MSTPFSGKTLMITGGTGSLGMELAGFITNVWKMPVCLVGHRALPPREQWDAIVEEASDSKLCRQINSKLFIANGMF